ncbi:MAG: RiPP maturation radical SAM protein 1, partial [Streptomyces sp.]|nr:RiPP maturation radical SAM protein 1 [Streptomyces sp.]
HVGARLTHTDLGDRIVLVSRRSGFPWRTRELTDPFEVAVFRLLDQPHAVTPLHRKATGRTSGQRDERELRALLADWVRDGIVFTDAGQYVHLAPPSVNQDLLRLDYMRHTHGTRAAEPALS